MQIRSWACLLTLVSATFAADASPWGDPTWHSKQGQLWGPNKQNVVWRDVTEFGAAGDGTTDDTEAFLRAILSNGVPVKTGSAQVSNATALDPNNPRCALGCGSSTVQPALVYVPPGTYLLSKPLTLPYMTNLIGSSVGKPTLKVTGNFKGASYLIDTDPYTGVGDEQWFANQNNFYRQIRNFVIDITGAPADIAQFSGIHWQVAQATTLQNIDFKMAPDSTQQGIFSESGSGGFMTDLTFSGGGIGAVLGSQQYTSRNMKFDGCQTAIRMLWCWGWVFHGLDIKNAQVGVDAATDPKTPQIGTIMILDSTIQASTAGVSVAWDPDKAGSMDDPDKWNGSISNLVLENVQFTGSAGVISLSNKTFDGLPAGGSNVAGFVQGAQYQGMSPASGATVPQNIRNGNMQRVLDSTGTTNDPLRSGPDNTIYATSKPSYDDVPKESFVRLIDQEGWADAACGENDATDFLQAAIAKAKGGVLYVNYGVYKLSSTLQIPPGTKIMGEMWPNFMIDGTKFTDATQAVPAIHVGGDGTGCVQISDIIVTTLGPAPGAIGIQWDLNSQADEPSGLWDVHMRIGGSDGTQLTLEECAKQPLLLQSGTMYGLQYKGKQAVQPCAGLHTMFYATKQSGNIYLENNWFWVADHDFERVGPKTEGAALSQIDIFSGRGVRIESQGGPIWMWATASEHSVLYNYQFDGAKNIFAGLTQVESPYYQPTVTAFVAITPDESINDPTFSECSGQGVTTRCIETWGLRMLDCSNIQMYGLGFYAFFQNYLQQKCINGINCQENMISIDSQSTGIKLHGIGTIAAVNMITYDGQSVAESKNFQSQYVQAMAMWESPN